MTIIIGIDPGSRKTGYGLIDVQGSKTRHIANGCLNMKSESLSVRLQEIYQGLRLILEQYQPQEAAIEQVFMQENANSALKLGQARGAALVALALPVSEYAPRAIKQAIVGHGGASKEQVQQMVKRMLNLDGKLQADAADALAIALCHAHSRQMHANILRSLGAAQRNPATKRSAVPAKLLKEDQ